MKAQDFFIVSFVIVCLQKGVSDHPDKGIVSCWKGSKDKPDTPKTLFANVTFLGGHCHFF